MAEGELQHYYLEFKGLKKLHSIILPYLSLSVFSSVLVCLVSGWGRAACSGQRVGLPAGDSKQTHTGQDLPVHQHRAHGGGMSRRWTHTSGSVGEVFVCILNLFGTQRPSHSRSQPVSHRWHVSRLWLVQPVAFLSCFNIFICLKRNQWRKRYYLQLFSGGNYGCCNS